VIDPQQAVDAVREDLGAVLGRWLPPADEAGHGFSVPEPFAFVGESGLRNEEGSVAVVPWEWRGVNGEGLFGLDPTFAPVTVRGTTIVAEPREGGELVFSRYIDWLDVLAQAGVAVYTRPIVDIRHGFDAAALAEVPEMAEALRLVARRESGKGER
jgi:hypothetical protein